MQAIDRNDMTQLSGGCQTFFEWLSGLFIDSNTDAPDRWINEEINYNAQY